VTSQQDLVGRVTDDLAADERVRGLWLTGSFGAGEADEFSDVDMFVLLPDSHLPAYVDAWLDDVAPRYHPLLARRLGVAPVFNHVLPGWLRWDVVLGGPAQLNDLDADRMGLLPVGVGRGELVTATSGAIMLRQMLTTLLRHRVEGPRMSGALHLRRVLPEHEMAALAALPPVYADEGAVVAAHLSAAALFLPVARELLGPDHPDDLETACWDHLARHLGVERPV